MAVIDPAALGRSGRKGKTAAKPAEKKTGGNKYIEYLGFFFKNGFFLSQGFVYFIGIEYWFKI